MWAALFHQRWESACVVVAIVAAEVVASLVPTAAADSVIARRVLLWAALGTMISVATTAYVTGSRSLSGKARNCKNSCGN